AEDGIRDRTVTGVQTCALPIYCVCPSTTASLVPKRPAANSTLPTWEGATMFPATRITNRSPNPCPNTSSAGTRESEQPKTMANEIGRASCRERGGGWEGGG